tara:strand:- start:52 stop:258 length:207 start_codon:yes stop_codon:yes gene_type:complete
MQDVPDNRDAFALKSFRPRMGRVEVTRQGEQIQQTLAGMTVQSIPTIEDYRAFPGSLKIPSQLLWDSR